MNKIKLIYIFLLFYSPLAFSGKGVVLVLQAPLIDQESFEGKPVAHVRRGQEIFIHDKHFGISSFQITFQGMADDEEVDKVEDGWKKDGFFQTLDASGNPAYIEKKYVKLIYNDTRELKTAVKPFKYDPTDYRLEEPLPRNYPLEETRMYRAGGYMAFGPNRKMNYNYPFRIISETLSGRQGFEIFYSRKVGFDIYDRFYFGGTGHIYAWESEFRLANNHFATEKGGEVGIGPTLSYIFFRNDNWRLTFTGGLTFNYVRHLVGIDDSTEGSEEERFFESFNITPKIKVYAVRKNLTPVVDLMAGFDITMNLPMNYASSTNQFNSDFWQEDPLADTVHVPFGGVWSFIIGINSTY